MFDILNYTLKIRQIQIASTALFKLILIFQNISKNTQFLCLPIYIRN
jgi:hypothetical protein